MATLESNEANILDAETINWRLIAYPVLAIVILVGGGLSYYYYQQVQRETVENQARAVLMDAKTPEAMIKVADQFPGTTHATLALLGAAQASFGKQDYAAATGDYQRIIGTVGTDAVLHDSAQIGLASALEASGKADDAVNAYLQVARSGDKTSYAPYAYTAAARIYEQKGDKDNERKILSEATSLDPDSQFVKQAQAQLKELNPPASMTVPVPNSTAPAPSANAVPSPVKP